MSNSTKDVGASERHATTVPQWKAGLQQTVSRLQNAGVPTVLISDAPNPAFDVPVCLSRAHAALFAPQDCTFQLGSALNNPVRQAEAEVMLSLGPGHLIDFTERICPQAECKVVRDGVILYRDDNHLTATFAAELGSDLLGRIDAALYPAPQAAR
jgi:hypothetical protein